MVYLLVAKWNTAQSGVGYLFEKLPTAARSLVSFIQPLELLLLLLLLLYIFFFYYYIHVIPFQIYYLKYVYNDKFLLIVLYILYIFFSFRVHNHKVRFRLQEDYALSLLLLLKYNYK